MDQEPKGGSRLFDLSKTLSVEDFRTCIFDLGKQIKDYDQPVQMGTETGEASYVLTPAKFLGDLEDFVPVTMGALKKDFTTAGILVRHLGVKFIVVTKLGPAFGLTKNPGYRSVAVERLLKRAALQTKNSILSGGSLEGQAEPSQDLSATILSRLEQMEGELTKHQNRMWSWLETKLN